MMDLIASCRDKLQYFRIKELKDVLNQLGLVRQGKKQDLVDRILATLSDEGAKVYGWTKMNSIGKEGVAKIIDDTFRKMQVPGASDLASKFQNSSDLTKKPKENVDAQPNAKVRCPCGSSLHSSESMIQCEDRRCEVWQHMSCVVIPEKPMEGVSLKVPSQFYCEICRVNRADPYWLTLAHPLLPVKMAVSNVSTDGTNTVQSVEKTFHLSRADRDLLQKQEYDLQAWCILLNDKVPFRMQWPQYVDLQVNGVPVRVMNRPGSQLLGANGRDDGPAITTCSREGINKISLSACDARVFCFGVRIAKRRTVMQVLSMIPKETDGEHFDEALARVCRCISGGTSAENADSDSDLEVMAESVTVNLRCPMSGSRMKIAGRFKPCVHMGCFDLRSFVELTQRSRKWQCPICLTNYSLDHVIIDPYFNRIVSMMQNCGEDVTEIDIKPDGCWRVKSECDNRDLAQWHLPDGSLSVINEVDVKPDEETLRQIKLGASDGQTSLKLGIKRNCNGIWEVNKPEDARALSSRNHVENKFENHCMKDLPISNSATDEDASVNQDVGGHIDISSNNGNDQSISFNFDATYVNVNRNPLPPSVEEDIIILSDSEDNGNVKILSPATFYKDGNAFPVAIQEGIDSFNEDPGLGVNANTGLDLFSNGDEFGIWSLHTDVAFDAFGADANDSDMLIDTQDTSFHCSTMNGFGLNTDTNAGDTGQNQKLSISRENAEMNGGLNDTRLLDPSFQIFLPTGKAVASEQENTLNCTDVSNVGSEDMLSLRLGASGFHGESPATDGLHSGHQFPAKETRIDSVTDTASLLSMNDNGSARATSIRPRSDGPFSHPRQPRSSLQQRSVRPRLYLSIDTDSD